MDGKTLTNTALVGQASEIGPKAESLAPQLEQLPIILSNAVASGPAVRVVANLARCARNPWGIALRLAPSGRTQPRRNSVASIWSETALVGETEERAHAFAHYVETDGG